MMDIYETVVWPEPLYGRNAAQVRFVQFPHYGGWVRVLEDGTGLHMSAGGAVYERLEPALWIYRGGRVVTGDLQNALEVYYLGLVAKGGHHA